MNELIISSLPILIKGLGITLLLSVAAIIGSTLLGLLAAVLRTSRLPVLKQIAVIYTELFRGTPVLITLMFIYFGVAYFGYDINLFAAGILGLSIYQGAYIAEVFRAGIEAVPAVTLEAASSLAFSRRQLLWNVQLPLALRFALPSLINNLIDLVKMTAVASAIAVGDITYAAIMIWTQSDNVLELMLLILSFFGLLSFIVNCVGRWLEARLRMPGYGH